MADQKLTELTPITPPIAADDLLYLVRAGADFKGTPAQMPVSTLQATADQVIADALAAHEGDQNNPHAVNKAQVGLGSADDTSDAVKPVSTAQQAALDLKMAIAAFAAGAYTFPASIAARISVLHGTAAQVNAITLEDGEIAVATRTDGPRELRVGDGATAGGLIPFAPSYNRSATVIVTTAASATTNGTNLLAAYTAAKALTPNGAALSGSNRATLLIPPGNYDLAGSELVLDSATVDILGLSPDRSAAIIKSNFTSGSNKGVIRRTVDGGRIANVTLAASGSVATSAAYWESGTSDGYVAAVMINVELIAAGSALTAGSSAIGGNVEGTFQAVKALSKFFGDPAIGAIAAAAVFRFCEIGNNSLGDQGGFAGECEYCTITGSAVLGATGGAAGTLRFCKLEVVPVGNIAIGCIVANVFTFVAQTAQHSSNGANTLTTTPTIIDDGAGPDPVQVELAIGTWLVTTGITVDFVGATYAAPQTVSFRCFDGAAALNDADFTATIYPVTTLTKTMGVVNSPGLIVTVTSGTKTITVKGSVSVLPSVGSMRTGRAWMTAVKVGG